MHVSETELRERYRALSTDELLAIAQEDSLTEVAGRLLREELSSRELSQEDLSHAEYAHAVIEADRELVRQDIRRRIRRMIIVLVLVAMLGIYIEVIA